MITFNELYSNTHAYSNGTVQINEAFSGNTLSIELTTKPEYLETRQVIGYLFQFKDDAQKAYAVYSGKDVIRLDLPESDKLWFSPTTYLSDNYTLTIGYTDVGTIINGSNSVSIPEQILGLPSRVTSLEGDLASLEQDVLDLGTPLTSVSWTDVTDKPSFFPPEEHQTFIGDVDGLAVRLSDIDTLIDGKASSSSVSTLSDDVDSLEGRVTTLEGTTPSGSSSISLITVSTNSTLESGKSYLATVSGLDLTLPTSPTIGDSIAISTGNFPTKVFHGNGSQTILNSNTSTSAGSSSGIILKTYSDVVLTFMGSNLWKTTYRARTVNNWIPVSIDASSSKQSYTATAPTSAYGAVIDGIYNGIKGTGALTNGYLSDVTTGNILVTLTNPIIIDQIRLCNGQANNGAGVNDPYSVRDIIIYTTHSTSGENLGTYTFSNTSPTEEVKTVTPNSIASTQFLLRVNSITPRPIGIIELEVWGKQQTGGEIVAT